MPSTVSAGGFAPDVIRRDPQGRATIRAIKLTDGIRLDGQLDEPVYHTVPALTDFVQLPPPPGSSAAAPPAHNGTAYWIKVSAQRDGSFTVMNARNGFSKTYTRGR